MDIENKKQKRRYIEIQIKDLGEFTDVSLLVDNDDFIDEIERVRDKYGLYYNFPVKDENLADDFTRKLYPHSQLRKNFDLDVEEIRKRFYRPPHFNVVIEAAIIYGAIGDGIYSRAYLEEQEFFSTENPEEIPDKKYSIIIHQRTRLPDIEHAFSEFKEMIQKNLHAPKGIGANYKTGFWADLSLQEVRDTVSSIEDLHRWYISGKKPLQITLEELSITEDEYREIKKTNLKKSDFIENRRNTIKKELSDFRKLLKKANRTIL